MSFFGFGSKEADEADSDPNKIISGWTGALIAPKWAEKDSYKVRVNAPPPRRCDETDRK
jgi:hypothetical protein